MVAGAGTSPPFSYSDPKDLTRLTGLEVELAEKIFECAGVKAEFVAAPWAGTLPSLLNGANDVAVGNINYRPDRAKQVDFVVFMRNGQSVIVNEGNPSRIKDAADLCGKTGSASIGGSSMLELERQGRTCVGAGKPAIQLEPAPEMEASYRQLGNKRINFVMDNTASATARLEKMSEFQIAYSMTTDIAFGPVFAKGNEEMQRILFDGLRALRANGQIEALVTKYKLPTDLLIPIEVRTE